ncbi:hypothetical protein [Streptomyces sp. NPDC048411]|uniref:hypothetical protein n=1 Tax=Streptomyces sp. NPDC048411 TaxID=3157206 RepID=UPI003453C006
MTAPTPQGPHATPAPPPPALPRLPASASRRGSVLRGRHGSLLDAGTIARTSEYLGENLPCSHEALPQELRVAQLGKDPVGFLAQHLNPLPGTPFPLLQQTDQRRHSRTSTTETTRRFLSAMEPTTPRLTS